MTAMQASSASSVIRIVKLLRGRGLLMAASIAFGLAFAGTTLIPPLLIRRLIIWLTQGGGTIHGLVTIAVSLGGVYLLRGISRYGYGRFSHVVAYQVLDDLMVRVYAHLQKLPHRFFTHERTGTLIARSINDIEAIEDFIAHGIPETVLAVVIPIAMLCVLFALNAPLALIVLLPIPFAALLVYRFTRGIRDSWRRVRSGLSLLVAHVQDSFSGIAEIKSFVREREQADQIAGHSATYRDAIIRANELSLLPAGIVEMTGGLGMILAIAFGGWAAMQGRMNIGDLFVFVAYLGHIYQPFLQLAGISDVLHKATSSAQRVFELLDIKPDIVSAPDAIAPKSISADIAFEHVTFGYSDEISVLQDVTFDVAEGEMVALVGATGAGKTTVTRLVPRFYDPQEGIVRIGGHDVRRLNLSYLRMHIASVLQDVFLFHGTVRQNLQFGRPDAKEDEIIAAAQAANAEEFILRLPDGYDTMIGERGVRLSGGQKQRLSIARALLKNAPILILDEATSSVDSETESLIQEALSRLTANRTTLIIAHRLSTISHADRIIVLDQGRIVEIGTHEDLLASGGSYARMVRAQDHARTWELGVKERLGVVQQRRTA